MGKVRYLGLCLCSFYVHMMSFGMSISFGIIYIELQELFQASKSATTWVQSLFSGVLLLSGTGAGIFVSKFGCRVVSATGSTLLTAALVASAFAPSLEVLYVTFAVGGIGASFMHAAAFVVIMKNFDKRQALAVGVTGTGVSVGSLVLPSLTYAANEEYGIRGSFFILACLSAQSVVASVLLGCLSKVPTYEIPSSAGPHDSESQSLKQRLRSHFRFISVGYILYAVSMNLLILAYFIPFLMFPDVAVSRGLTKQQASIIATCLGVGATVGRSAFAFIGDIKRVDRLYLHIVPVAMFGVFTIVVVHAWNFLGFILLSMFVGLTSAPAAAIHPIIISDLVDNNRVSVALGWFWFLLSLSTVVGPPIAGWITDIQGNYESTIFFSGSLLLASSAVAIFVLIWKRRQNINNIDSRAEAVTHNEPSDVPVYCISMRNVE